MKKYLFPSMAFMASAALLVAVNAARAEDIIAKSYDIKNVTEVIAGGGCRMKITQGESDSLQVEAKQEAMNRVRVDQTGSRLTLSIKSPVSSWNVFKWLDAHNDEVTYILQLKNLNRLELGGACRATLGDWTAKDLAVYASGASNTDFNKLNVDNFFMELSGASNGRFQAVTANKTEFHLSGAANVDVKTSSSAKNVQIEASGASNFRAKLLVATQADVGASGASNIELQVNELLKANASGASNVRYLGQPRLQSDASGASNIKSIN